MHALSASAKYGAVRLRLSVHWRSDRQHVFAYLRPPHASIAALGSRADRRAVHFAACGKRAERRYEWKVGAAAPCLQAAPHRRSRPLCAGPRPNMA
eukprot:7147387-Prymnesium_polylepis.2